MDVAIHVCKPSSFYLYDRDGVQLRQSRIDGSIQKVVSESLVVKLGQLSVHSRIFSINTYFHVVRGRIQNVVQFPVLAGHPDEKPFNNILWRQFYCTHMVDYAYALGADFDSCAVEGMRNSHKKLNIFQPLAAWVLGDGNFVSETKDEIPQ